MGSDNMPKDGLNGATAVGGKSVPPQAAGTIGLTAGEDSGAGPHEGGADDGVVSLSPTPQPNVLTVLPPDNRAGNGTRGGVDNPLDKGLRGALKDALADGAVPTGTLGVALVLVLHLVESSLGATVGTNLSSVAPQAEVLAAELAGTIGADVALVTTTRVDAGSAGALLGVVLGPEFGVAALTPGDPPPAGLFPTGAIIGLVAPILLGAPLTVLVQGVLANTPQLLLRTRLSG